MHFVKNTLAANLEMVTFIASKFFLSCRYDLSQNPHFLIKFFMIWLGELWLDLLTFLLKLSPMSTIGWNLRISWAYLLDSTWRANEEGRILEESFHKGSYLWYQIQSNPWLESWRLSNSHWELLVQSQNHETFDPLAFCMWKPSGKEWLCFLYIYIRTITTWTT